MRKPTRRDLLVIIGRLQNITSSARSAMNDRNPHRAAEVEGYLGEALELCIKARGYDPPIEKNLGPWGVTGPQKKYT
jgi:hypothetical protein